MNSCLLVGHIPAKARGSLLPVDGDIDFILSVKKIAVPELLLFFPDSSVPASRISLKVR